MRMAVIGDIHGNIYALDCVLNDIQKKQVDIIVSTGDLVGYLPYPNEVIMRIRENRILVVQGNHDWAISTSDKLSLDQLKNMSLQDIQKDASKAYTNWCILDENRKYLKNLCSKVVFQCENTQMVIVHGGLHKIDEYLYEDEVVLEKLASDLKEDVLICGHTHCPYIKKIKNKYFINAGSVGKPKHGNSKSTYVILEVADNEIQGSIEEVAYDVEKMINDIKENPMISDDLIELLRTGKE